jgi:ATP-dependent DNA helicase DinG
MSQLADAFGPGGALARAFAGFVPRPSQRRMAERIAKALEGREHLLVEAGRVPARPSPTWSRR